MTEGAEVAWACRDVIPESLFRLEPPLWLGGGGIAVPRSQRRRHALPACASSGPALQPWSVRPCAPRTPEQTGMEIHGVPGSAEGLAGSRPVGWGPPRGPGFSPCPRSSVHITSAASSPQGPPCSVSLGPRAASDPTLSPLPLGDLHPTEPPTLDCAGVNGREPSIAQSTSGDPAAPSTPPWRLPSVLLLEGGPATRSSSRTPVRVFVVRPRLR
ncbi:hypothetical protein HJG60_008826 [Phyllostomus discolor]|uniref:Uncharacterized protein n=1 Tax=Phyllostomus discolor TaxID=89673 RepID=A0A833YU47_9CHIR|nr:hypothetical protein HJG60_008826 [Phyllostomus discolor]